MREIPSKDTTEVHLIERKDEKEDKTTDEKETTHEEHEKQVEDDKNNEEEPVQPIDELCNPEPLPHVSDDLCVGDFNKNAFTGKLRKTPVKTIVHSVKFSFEVDVLEIHLNELYDVVDYFFIVESVNAHADSSPKPLLWEFLKNQPRFKKFEKKIVRLILDDSSVTLPSPDFGIWVPEIREEVIRWEKIKQWLDHYKLSSDALIGFGDGDEITSRHLVHRMRYCELKKEVFDIGMLFSFGNLEKAYSSGYLSLNYAFSGATFWTYDAPRNSPRFPRSFNYFLLGVVARSFKILTVVAVRSS
ncbi:uncharacterized protein LOC134841579 [Symsagittifera roscoffensis]|uniref:uncharacterized protein LOC134841579 n=1 Tax=Symsagittifera roscoffensis TaxID=84072 RepID=UPI00307B85EE